MTEYAIVGKSYTCTEDLVTLCEEAGNEQYNFLLCSVVHPWCCLQRDALPDVLPPITADTHSVVEKSYAKYFCAKLSPWIDVDSKEQKLRSLSEEALLFELLYYENCRFPSVFIELNGRKCHDNLARIISQFIARSKHLKIRLGVPIFSTNELSENNDDPWEWFYVFRTKCNNKVDRIGVALMLTNNIPEINATILDRWYGEPVKLFVVDTSLFIKADDGVTLALPKCYERFIRRMFNLKIRLCVTGDTSIHDETCAAKFLPNPYFLTVYGLYFNYLFKNKPQADQFVLFNYSCDSDNMLSPIIQSSQPTYYDYLRGAEHRIPCPDGWRNAYHTGGSNKVIFTPAEPLIYNLPNKTYEVFESDEIKYSTYRKAIGWSIDRYKFKHIDDAKEGKIVFMVLGAGRGPLVTEAIAAIAEQKVKEYVIYVVEKNHNVIPLLQHYADTKWAGVNIRIINSHFRDVQMPEDEKADIVISELLGAFGDNELSPECLDSAMHLMKDDLCVSVPESYTSWIAPICSPKIFNDIPRMAKNTKDLWKAYETHYVVCPETLFVVDKPQELFTFNHPNFENKSNDRRAVLTFTASETCDLHGLLGYFTANLLGDCTLSIVPGKTHTRGLFSWYPFYFPFKFPIYVKKGEKITIDFRRCSNNDAVWYEWTVLKPILTSFSNQKGRGYVLKKF